MDIGGQAWALVGVGIALTGLAMAYGMWRSRRMTGGEKRAQQRATHENFRRESE